MTNEQNDAADGVPDLPATETSDDLAAQVKGGAVTQPGGPVPIPYPNIPKPGTGRTIVPCV